MSPLLIEGYASLFGVEDDAGDVVRAGAFARSLAVRPTVGMLLQHAAGRRAGSWTRIKEDGRGLWVRGLIEGDLPSGRAAQALALNGTLDGLSIGFVARQWRPRIGRGRELIEVELVEISLVSAPMLAGARFDVLGAPTSLFREAA